MDYERISTATEVSDSPLGGGAARARLPRPVREQQMLEAATELFGRLGYHSVSMDQIADEIGVSKPMLYAYFDNKEGLCNACIERAGRDIIAALRISWEPDNSPEQLLWAGFHAFFDFIADHPESWRLIRNKYSYDEPTFRSHVAAIHQELLAELQLLTASAAAEGERDPFGDSGTRDLAASAVFGAARTIADGWIDAPGDGDPEEAATQLMNFFWVGLRALADGDDFSPLTAS